MSADATHSAPPLRIVFAGTPDFAAHSLQAVLKTRHQVVAIYTQPDRPAGRGKKLTPSPVKMVAQAHQIPVYQPINFKSDEAVAELADLKPDLMVVVAYGLLLPQRVLDIPRLGCINVHGSLLPRWRGAAPIQRALQAGDSETGITIMQMEAGLDTGPMLLKLPLTITDQDTGGSLHDKLAILGAHSLTQALTQLSDGTLSGEVQQSDLATYAHKLSKEEAQLNWLDHADNLARTVRAFNPWPVAFTVVNGERVRILKAIAEPAVAQIHSAPGTVISKDRQGIIVQCGTGQLRILELQLPGARAQSVNDFINGGKAGLDAGTHLESPEPVTPSR
ncbi:MAG: methionyl-tRNA formyltransferase [Hahellaceae bacterium]|nr:methionyl-tRNA formyltransferase [Hahellaceae bacterium]